ncbi:hypothetical protein [Blastopirellula marina]|uniref:Uncharacterized protein n=1 Tax=Blastopirellula marina TaxID=124 RepID=A0A2S8F7T2_9BACT|nr:hypothetical protein [Blastopirellula marina]PQO28217.1 hypothetical protein C5Y98_25295 [Blastopirellula marina]PTL41757.1 hypothetical protein C5Y97_25310 [Blastopirellula marina]
MRRRRRSNSADSLELLLDTICNTFGGVLFIAILVVILLRMTGESSDEEQTPSIAPEQFQEFQNRLTSLTREISLLQKNRSGQQRLAEKFAEQEVRDQIITRNTLQEAFNDLAREYNQQLAENAGQSHLIEKTRSENFQTDKDLQETQAKLEDLQRELVEERNSRVQKMRSPVVRSSGFKSEVGVILRYGRMYVWHRYNRAGTRLGLNTDEFVVVGKEGNSMITQPIPTAGIPLREDSFSRGKLQERLRQFSPRSNIIAVIVRPDSYRQFSILRDVLLNEGFEYRLMPMNEKAEVADRGGLGGKVQ